MEIFKQRIVFAAVLALAPASALADEDAKLELGKEVFVERAAPACGICHTLSDAGSEGDIGPNLDRLQPDGERVETAVRQGIDIMPSFADLLSEEEIAAVAHYVSSVAGEDGSD